MFSIIWVFCMVWVPCVWQVCENMTDVLKQWWFTWVFFAVCFNSVLCWLLWVCFVANAWKLALILCFVGCCGCVLWQMCESWKDSLTDWYLILWFCCFWRKCGLLRLLCTVKLFWMVWPCFAWHVRVRTETTCCWVEGWNLRSLFLIALIVYNRKHWLPCE